MSKKFVGTEKQREILSILMKQLDKGDTCTVNDIYINLSYTCTKPSLLCSIRFLEKHGMIIKEKGATQFEPMTMRPTLKAYEMIRREPMVFEDEEE